MATVTRTADLLLKLVPLYKQVLTDWPVQDGRAGIGLAVTETGFVYINSTASLEETVRPLMVALGVALGQLSKAEGNILASMSKDIRKMIGG